MALAKTTRDHDEIRKWAEERGGKPGAVKATETADDPGILRLFFPNAPNHNDDAIEEIPWEEFFQKFDESGLQLTYQEETADGQKSDFNKLTYPEPDSSEGKQLLAKTARKRSSSKKSAGRPAKASGKKSAKTAPKASGKKTSAKKQSKPSTKTSLRASGSKSASKKAPAKKAPAKKQAAKKAAGKKVAGKKAAGKKTAAKKTAGKKTAAKKSSSRTRR